MIAEKWNYKTHKYDPYELPDGACLYSEDMNKVISCASCGKQMLFGDGYTSWKIHNRFGLGYAVCEKCYDAEWKEENEQRRLSK